MDAYFYRNVTEQKGKSWKSWSLYNLTLCFFLSKVIMGVWQGVAMDSL
jgi:hypothetical protein